MEFSQCNSGMCVLLLPVDYEQTRHLAPTWIFGRKDLRKEGNVTYINSKK
jgi:hypothetical protein